MGPLFPQIGADSYNIWATRLHPEASMLPQNGLVHVKQTQAISTGCCCFAVGGETGTDRIMRVIANQWIVIVDEQSHYFEACGLKQASNARLNP